MKIAIIKYNAGNVVSVKNALNRIGVTSILTDTPAEIMSADKVIFPGVGEATSAMKYLKSKNLDQVIKNLTQPVLGICLGMQLMCNFSEENETKCLGIFDINVKKFPDTQKVPHMGWNLVKQQQPHPLWQGIDDGARFYFVHSYYAASKSNDVVCGVTEYGISFTSAIAINNAFACQFHPEKSSKDGLRLLKNFIDWDGGL